MAVGSDEQVFGLQVPIRYLLLVQVLEREHDLRDVKERHVVREEILSSEQAEDFAALDVLKVKVNVRGIFETLMPTCKQMIKFRVSNQHKILRSNHHTFRIIVH